MYLELLKKTIIVVNGPISINYRHTYINTVVYLLRLAYTVSRCTGSNGTANSIVCVPCAAMIVV